MGTRCSDLTTDVRDPLTLLLKLIQLLIRNIQSLNITHKVEDEFYTIAIENKRVEVANITRCLRALNIPYYASALDVKGNYLANSFSDKHVRQIAEGEIEMGKPTNIYQVSLGSAAFEKIKTTQAFKVFLNLFY